MNNTPLDPTVPSPEPNDNPHDPPANIGHPIKLDPGVIVEIGHGNGDDGDDDDGNGNGNGDEKCIESLEDLVQRLGNLDALAYCALFLLGEIPRDPSPSAEAPTRRLWRIVEILANDIGRALRFADAAVAILRGSHRKRGGNDDGSNGNGGGVQS